MSQECYVALLEREKELDPELAGKICRTRIETILREQEQKRTKKENKIRFVSADLPSVSRLLSKIATEQEGPISETELYQAVDSLDENYRAAVREVYVNGLTQKDAAEKLGITIWSLRWKLGCGIMDLKLKLEVKD
jgi:DNA-directed RNA polymerase specialized sigma24 family protein